MQKAIVGVLLAGLWGLASVSVFAADPTPVPAPLLIDPVWRAGPRERDLRLFYPDGALRDGVGGFAVVTCTVGAGGALADCATWGEDPRGQGFAIALLNIAKYMEVAPTSASGAPTLGRTVRLGAKFMAPTITGVDDERVEVVTVQR